MNDTNDTNDTNIALNQPLYMYQMPMFMLTVSVAIIVEDFIVVDAAAILKGILKLPTGVVRAGQESIQFAAVRYVKEQTGILLKKELIVPVDFRSDPERSPQKNVVDIGLLCYPNESLESLAECQLAWLRLDFENKNIVPHPELKAYMDHNILVERAVNVYMMLQ